jgi:hypothetical protein
MNVFRYGKRVPYFEERMQQLETRIGHLEKKLEDKSRWADRLEPLLRLIETRIKEPANKTSRTESDACGECGFVPIMVRRQEARGFRVTIRLCPECGAVLSEAKHVPLPPILSTRPSSTARMTTAAEDDPEKETS